MELAEVVNALRTAGCVYAEEEAALLIEAAEAVASPAELDRLVAARVAGTPLEVLLGWVAFDGLRILLDPGVFVPRQRTVLLVELAAAAAAQGWVAVDLCCGSGGLAAALGVRRPDLEVHAADLDPAAVACARRNLPSGRVHEGDLYDALPSDLAGRVGVLVVNAPYVPSGAIALLPPEARDHEPRLALDGGGDGLEVHRRVAAGAGAWLAPGGVLLIEVSTAQAPAALELMAAHDLRPEVVEDEDRDATAVRATRAD